MKIKKYLMLIFIISIAYFISSETYADEINDSTQVEAELISKETDDEIYKNKELDFAREGIEKFYLNRDMDENNDLSKYFSDDMLKLLNFKIKYGKLKREELGFSYSDYKVIFKTIDKDKWKKTNNEFSFNLQVIKNYTDKDSDSPSEESIVLEMKVVNDGKGNLVITECYQHLYSDVDEKAFKEKVEQGENVDKWLEDNFNNLLPSLKETKLQQEENQRQYKRSKDAQESIDFRRNISFNRQVIANWVRKNFSVANSSDSSPFFLLIYSLLEF